MNLAKIYIGMKVSVSMGLIKNHRIQTDEMNKAIKKLCRTANICTTTGRPADFKKIIKDHKCTIQFKGTGRPRYNKFKMREI